MTSEEIRVRKDGMQRMAIVMSADELAGIPGATSCIALWLAEIAYQLAKANERNETHDGQ